MQKYFQLTNAMVRKSRSGNLMNIDQKIVEEELKDFFDNCGLSPYLKRDLKKIERRLRRKSKLHILYIRHNDDAVPYAKKTIVGFATRCIRWYDPGFREYQYCWD
ncbi:hypothetical protein IKF43_01505 [Candidatus Saccharibacteria bacterium]|nr:hypothetical protein [Candidatus Saccharibacteria bacterium]